MICIRVRERERERLEKKTRFSDDDMLKNIHLMDKVRPSPSVVLLCTDTSRKTLQGSKQLIRLFKRFWRAKRWKKWKNFIQNLHSYWTLRNIKYRHASVNVSVHQNVLIIDEESNLVAVTSGIPDPQGFVMYSFSLWHIYFPLRKKMSVILKTVPRQTARMGGWMGNGILPLQIS